MKRFNRPIKNLAMAAIDTVLVITALAISVYLRFDWNVPPTFLNLTFRTLDL